MREGVPSVPFMKHEADIFHFLGLEYITPENRKNEFDVRPAPTLMFKRKKITE